MQRFLKDNFALAVGIILPLILVVLFLAAGKLARDTTPDPQYDALFAVDYGGNSEDSRYVMDVTNGKLVIRRKPIIFDEPIKSDAIPRLFIFRHNSKYATRVNIDFNNVKDDIVVDPELDVLNKSRIDTSNISPDGYHFEYKSYSDNTLFTEIFSNHSRDATYVLKKDAKEIPILGSERYYQAFFLGWLESGQ
jgi:hypothetical protein